MKKKERKGEERGKKKISVSWNVWISPDLPSWLQPTQIRSGFFVRPPDVWHIALSPRLLHDTNGQHICLGKAQELDISDNRNKFPVQVSLMHRARFRIRKNILSFQADKAGTVIIYKICNRSPLVGFELRIVIYGTKSREEVKLGNLAAISSILYMHHCTIDTIYICTRRPLMWIESCTNQDEVKLGNSKAIIKLPLSSPTPPMLISCKLEKQENGDAAPRVFEFNATALKMNLTRISLHKLLKLPRGLLQIYKMKEGKLNIWKSSECTSVEL